MLFLLYRTVELQHLHDLKGWHNAIVDPWAESGQTIWKPVLTLVTLKYGIDGEEYEPK